MEAVRGQKHRWEAKKGMKELIYQKKYLTEFLNNLKNPLEDPIRFELWPHIKKIQRPPVEVAAATAATAATAKRLRSPRSGIPSTI